MSQGTTNRTINVKATDNTTSTLLAVARTARSVSREIHFLQMAFDILAESELTAATAAQLAIPIIGIFAAGISILAGARLIQAREGILPVGQTAPGEYRMMRGTGPILGHAGEIISRPMQGGAGGPQGLTMNFYNARISGRRDVQEILDDLSTGVQYSQLRQFRT